MISTSGKISILAIGSEILDGRVLDTNSRFGANVLADHGIVLDQILSCDDDLEAIKNAIGYLLKSVDIVVCSGGLGPTNDDLTREAIAQYAALPLETNQDLLHALEQRYLARQRPFDRSNAKQALIPRDAEILLNPVGTAPGFVVSVSAKLIFALPGVPQEFEKMFAGRCKELIVAKFPSLAPLNTHTFKTFGLPEASVGSRISGCNLPQEISVSYRAHFPEVEVKLKSRGGLQAAIEQTRAALEPHNIFSESPQESYPLAVVECARRDHFEFILDDRVTNGVLSQLLAQADPLSSVFKGSVLLPENLTRLFDTSILNVNCRITLACQNLDACEYCISIEQPERRVQQQITARFDPGFLQRYLAFCVLKELHRFLLKSNDN